MENRKKLQKSDLWMIILDIIAVNISYFLALMIRYCIDFKIRPVALDKYLPAFVTFAPYYTVACIVIFWFFRLYGGLWKYAGINDMNRIVFANITTTVFQVAGSWIFVLEMPKSYYVLGMTLQFIFLVLIRFTPRIIAIEKHMITMRKAPAMNVMVIGLGEIGQQVIHQIQTNKAFRPVCYYDFNNTSDDGRQYDGIPVFTDIQKLNDVISQYKVQRVFIADQQLNSKNRQVIEETCLNREIEIQDYTGYLSNIDDSASLSGVLRTVKGPVTISLYDEETTYDSGYQALKELNDSYSIESISSSNNQIKIEIRNNQQVVFVLKDDKTEAYVGYDAWESRKKEND